MSNKNYSHYKLLKLPIHQQIALQTKNYKNVFWNKSKQNKTKRKKYYSPFVISRKAVRININCSLSSFGIAPILAT